jgi:hypothetical protein
MSRRTATRIAWTLVEPPAHVSVWLREAEA